MTAKNKNNSAKVISLSLLASIFLTIINYFAAFHLNSYFLEEDFNLNYFFATIIILITIESAYIARAAKTKLLAILATTTIPTWFLSVTLFGYYGLFSEHGADFGHYITNLNETFEYIALNLFLLLFSYLGSLIGLSLKSSKKRK